MIFAPAGIERYFEELTSVLGDEAAEDRVAARYGITLEEGYGAT